MNNEGLWKLIETYGNACYDCGEHDSDNTNEPYEDVYQRQQEARKKIEEYLEQC